MRFFRVAVGNLNKLHNGRIQQRYHFRLLDPLVTVIKYKDDRDINISRDERLRVPSVSVSSEIDIRNRDDLLAVDEGCIATSQQQDDERDESYPCSVRLEVALPWQSITADALSFHGVEEPEINHADY